MKKIEQTKICNKCNIVKDINMFSAHKASEGGVEGICKDCKKIRRLEYKKEKKVILATKKRDYDIVNKEKISIYNREYALKNIDKISAKQREYRKTDNGRAVYLADASNRKMAINDGDVTASQIKLLIAENKNCYYCGIDIIKFHIDHYIPIKHGGRHTIKNLVISCPKCNLSKGSKMPSGKKVDNR
jgi:hypothetical protein